MFTQFFPLVLFLSLTHTHTHTPTHNAHTHTSHTHTELEPDIIAVQEVKLTAKAPPGAKKGDGRPRCVALLPLPVPALIN